MFAGRNGLDNLCGILDYNQVQQTGKVAERLDLEPVVAKWRSFNWHVREIDGHDMPQILDALDEAEVVHDRPTLIVAHGVKGKGVSWMELNSAWHWHIYDAAKSSYLLEFIRRLWDRYPWRTMWVLPGRTQKSIEEHSSVMEAIEARDPVEAGARMRAHILSGEKSLLDSKSPDDEDADLTEGGERGAG
jgi:DNA-binding GntR family transcriptional regulator